MKIKNLQFNFNEKLGDLKDLNSLSWREKWNGFFQKKRGDFVIQHNLTHWLRYGGIRDGAKQLFEGEGGLN